MFGNKITVRIDGMNCEHCAKKIKDNLEKIENVKSVKVNLKDKNATIKYKKNINHLEVKNIIESLDYKYIGVCEDGEV